MKLLTFIEKEEVHLAPKTKILKSSEFATLLEANAILAKAQSQAEDFRKQVTQECEKLKEQAELAGFNTGLKAWNEQLTLLSAEIHTVREEMEKAIAPLALTAAKKIIDREIELSSKTVTDIVMVALKPVTQHKKVTIYVNAQDLEHIEKNRPRIKDLFEHLESLSIIARDDVTSGGCVIETEAGIINATLEKQWEALEEAFKKLLKQQKQQT